ncbi:DUF397 domain-containing protein (plasmid) [Embleya sp. NBC_00888]|uniref:DUF397 domain-containing protein n=1 Tax=Embleya sp. NBC_00888 TaxID=2975960 RepID=UPI002F908848|nr:DUF397 domain-containing protein [Embleya sp. NBC_00888]
MTAAADTPAAGKPSAADLDLDGVTWEKPSGSLGEDNCVQFARVGDHVVWRDSKNPQQTPLVYTRDEIRALIRAARDGELDHLVE